MSEAVELDRCQICNGARGGARGNENIEDGVVICDYCHSDRMAFRDLSASARNRPSLTGEGEPVAWRYLFGSSPDGCWSYAATPPAPEWAEQCRKVQPLYARPNND